MKLNSRQVNHLNMQVANNTRLAQKYNSTNHVAHLLMSLVTFGIWIPIWMLASLSNSIESSRRMRKTNCVSTT